MLRDIMTRQKADVNEIEACYNVHRINFVQTDEEVWISKIESPDNPDEFIAMDITEKVEKDTIDSIFNDI